MLFLLLLLLLPILIYAQDSCVNFAVQYDYWAPEESNFTFVSDVVDAFMKSIHSSINRDVFNVGSGNTYSINYLVKLLGGKSVHLPKRPGEPDSTFADISKIKTSLKWNPITPFEKGVQIMIDNIDQWQDAPIWDESTIQKATQNWFDQLSKNTNDKGNK